MSRTNKKPFTRKTSRGPRERQRSCRNHGPCGWCLGNRTIAAARTKALVKEGLREIQNENRYERVELIAPGQYRVMTSDTPNGPWRELARTREEVPLIHRGNWPPAWTQRQRQDGSVIEPDDTAYCNHPNENPNFCPCGPECWCRRGSGSMCSGKPRRSYT